MPVVSAHGEKGAQQGFGILEVSSQNKEEGKQEEDEGRAPGNNEMGNDL